MRGTAGTRNKAPFILMAGPVRRGRQRHEYLLREGDGLRRMARANAAVSQADKVRGDVVAHRVVACASSALVSVIAAAMASGRG